MPIHKKNKKDKRKKTQLVRRNAAPAVALPRAIARPRRTTSDLVDAEIRKQDAEIENKREDTAGWRLINGLGGAILTSAAGLIVEHNVSRPTAWITAGALTAAGGVVGLYGPSKGLRSAGVGTALAGTALLGSLIDKQWFPHEEKTDEHPQVASSAGTAKPTPPGKKGQSNASDIPAEALARAYERARLRMALASEPPN